MKRNFCKPRINYLISFIVSASCMLIFLRLNSVHGTYAVLGGDSLTIYVPAIRNLWGSILSGNNIYYSWNQGLGTDMSLFNAYYAFSPFNILYVILKGYNDNTITYLLIILKTGLAGLCFYHYVYKVHGLDDYLAILISVFYSMCSFQVVYNIINIIWMDSLFVLPMVMASVYELYNKESSINTIFWYSYIFISQFYMGYVIGIFSMLYLGLLYITDREKPIRNKTKRILRWLGTVAVSIGISAFVWLPVLSFIIKNKSLNSNIFQKTHIDIFSVLGQFFWRELAAQNAQIPNLYCGLLTVLLIPLFWLSKRVLNRIKIIYGGLWLFMLFSCIIDSCYIMWHGFECPDGWPFRFAYIISFLSCVMASIVAKDLESKDIRAILGIAIVELLLFALLMIKRYNVFNWYNFICSSLFITLWIVLIRTKRNHNSVVVIIAMFLLTCVEIIMAYYGHPFLTGGITRTEYDIWDITEKETVNELSEDEDFYRVNYINDLGINSGLKYGFKTMAMFSSAENPTVRNGLSQMGIYTTPRLIMNYGLTPVTKMLLSVRYDVHGVVLKPDMAQDDLYATIERNTPVLNLGYMVCGDADDYDISEENPFIYNNKLLSVMTGEDINVFSCEDNYEIDEQGMKITKDEHGYTFDVYEEADNPRISFTCENQGTCYSYIYNIVSQKLGRGFVLAGGDENEREYFGELAVSYIKPMIKDHEVNRLDIIAVDDTKEQHIDEIFFSSYSDSELKKAYDLLKDNQLNVDMYDDSHIKGEVETTEDKHILFLSIPYDNGWTVKVDGIEGNVVPIMNNTFMAVYIPEKGKHIIELSYWTKSEKIGVLLSVLSGIIYLCMIYVSKRIDYNFGNYFRKGKIDI